MILPIKFYAAKMCPYAQRVAISLYELGLLDNNVNYYTQTNPPASKDPVEVVFIDLSNKPDWYIKQVNASGKVPVIEISNGNGSKELMTESIPISEFLLQMHDHPSLLSKPGQGKLRYKSSLITDAFNSQIITNFYGLLKEKNELERPKHELKLIDGIKTVQALLSPTGPYALGQDFSIADILCAPVLARMFVLEHYRQFKVSETSEFSVFNQWTESLLARKSVQNTLPEPNYLIEAYKKFTI